MPFLAEVMHRGLFLIGEKKLKNEMINCSLKESEQYKTSINKKYCML